MINRIINLLSDVLLILLLLFLTPLLVVLMTSAPIYGKVTGILFMALITGTVIFSIKKYRRNRIQKEI
jgi:Ca2+/Na+ antiporter